MKEKYLKLIIKESLLNSLINAMIGNKRQKNYTYSRSDSSSSGYGGGYGGGYGEFDIHDYDHYSTPSHSLNNSEKEEFLDTLSKSNTDQDTDDDNSFGDD